MNQPFTIRPARADDLNFIFDTFLKSYRKDSATGRACQTAIFYDNYRQVLDNLLSKSPVTVACLPDNPHIILGYLISEPSIIHYIFVKEAFRKLGIARALVASALPPAENRIVFYTHQTRFIESFIRNFPVLSYNPFLLYQQGAVNVSAS